MLQKATLNESAFIVLYPTPSVLKKIVRPRSYLGRPFSLMLACGCAQLEPRFFDLSVLETYRNDPRYYYEVDPGEEIGPEAPGSKNMGLWFHDPDGYRWELSVQGEG